MSSAIQNPLEADSDSDNNDDWIYEHENAASVEVGASTIKKISQKEKSIYEMIDVLNARLDTLNNKVVEQQELCAEDINPNSELYSHNLKTNDFMDVDVGSGMSSKRRQSMLFREAVSGTGSMEDEAKRLREKVRASEELKTRVSDASVCTQSRLY